MPRTRSGAIQSQGDFAQNSDLVRTSNALDGSGVTVGVISDSYNCYPVYASNGVPANGLNGYANNGFNTTAAGDTTSGDLPASVNVIKDATCMNYGAPIQLPFGDEGRAMMQIIHDVAPGAGLAFYTAENSEADFANGIVKLAASVASGGAKNQIDLCIQGAVGNDIINNLTPSGGLGSATCTGGNAIGADPPLCRYPFRR